VEGNLVVRTRSVPLGFFAEPHKKIITSQTQHLTMFPSTAVRFASRRVVSAASRRTFSATAAKVAKNDSSRNALVAAVGMTMAVAAFQQDREVSCLCRPLGHKGSHEPFFSRFAYIFVSRYLYCPSWFTVCETHNNKMNDYRTRPTIRGEPRVWNRLSRRQRTSSVATGLVT
jgi:hypothetical protein